VRVSGPPHRRGVLPLRGARTKLAYPSDLSEFSRLGPREHARSGLPLFTKLPRTVMELETGFPSSQISDKPVGITPNTQRTSLRPGRMDL
jgi:hypothetical protein